MRWLNIGGVIGLVAGVSLLAGLWLGSPSQESLAVSSQKREDQITISLGTVSAVTMGSYVDQSPGAVLALDPGDYPASTTFRLELVVQLATNTVNACHRLYDRTAGTGVAASEVCFTAQGTTIRHRTAIFPLASGEHEYVLQASAPNGGPAGTVWAARVIAEWNESIVMGPGPFPVGGYVRLVESGTPGSSVVQPAGAAIGLMMIGAGGLYVARMRRSTRSRN